MRAIAQGLFRLFKMASRISARTGQGLLQRGAGKYAVNAVRNLRITVRGVTVNYHDLAEADRAAVDEAVEYAVRFAAQYIDHHDQYTQYRIDENSLESVLMSHAEEIMEAAKGAFYSRIRSHSYDYANQKLGVFQDDPAIKQLVLAIIQEVAEHINDEA